MGKVLSDANIARYHRDGFLFPIDAFSPQEAHGFRDRLEAFERRDGRQFGKGHNFKPHLCFPGSMRWCATPRCSTRSRI
jgi:non-heme Fe2+,alpha-ketoglutarate-dependent halogenase